MTQASIKHMIQHFAASRISEETKLRGMSVTDRSEILVSFSGERCGFRGALANDRKWERAGKNGCPDVVAGHEVQRPF